MSFEGWSFAAKRIVCVMYMRERLKHVPKTPSFVLRIKSNSCLCLYRKFVWEQSSPVKLLNMSPARAAPQVNSALRRLIHLAAPGISLLP